MLLLAFVDDDWIGFLCDEKYGECTTSDGFLKMVNGVLGAAGNSTDFDLGINWAECLMFLTRLGSTRVDSRFWRMLALTEMGI